MCPYTMFLASFFQDTQQFGIVPGFHHKVEGTAFHAFHGEGDVGVGREKHHLHLGEVALEFGEPEEAFVARVDVGVEVHVKQHCIGLEGSHGFHQHLGRSDEFHFGKTHRQQNLQRRADARVVVDY